NAFLIMDKSIRAVVLDIEGTTTPISFVTNVLFPFVVKNVEDFLLNTWTISETQNNVESLRQQAAIDVKEFGTAVPQILPEDTVPASKTLRSVVDNVIWQMSLNRKTTALKELQGMIWINGYESGEIKGLVFEDVKPALDKLQNLEKNIYIYSSGSVAAQKLLFKYSEVGDMLPYFNGHFDTKIGSKNDPASYKSIANYINCNPEEILFLTDVEYEANAATSAGFQVCVVLRPGNKLIDAENLKCFKTISNFSELFNSS
uniref:Enolase-phosphatase E1 n=1 Tax=Ciona savignyi TaxID=51511 RepID=H2YZ94_CIOSA